MLTYCRMLEILLNSYKTYLRLHMKGKIILEGEKLLYTFRK
jgi:hypothetical protein